jgi:hypothetical protein
VAEIGCGLFLSLQQSQDVEGVDMGHILIGLDARMSWSSRVPNIPAHGATGVGITTWVGDLGGATARLAVDRTKNPSSARINIFVEPITAPRRIWKETLVRTWSQTMVLTVCLSR